MHRSRLENIYLSGVGMGLSDPEKLQNDMTHTGVMCPNDSHEMERVSGSDMHVCHWCGGQWRVDEKGQIGEAQFEGH